MTSGIGDTLRDAREEQGRSIEDAARALRLRSEQLRALEDERFDSFGGDVYARGFLKSYALELGLDPKPLLDTFRRDVTGDDPLTSAPLVAPGAGSTAVKPSRGAPPGWIAWVLVGVLVLAGLGFLGQFVGSRAPEQASSDPTSPPVAPADNGEDDDVEPADDDADADGDPADDDDEEDEPPPAPDGIELFLALEDASWMRVTVDGTVVFEQVADEGVTERFTGEESVTVRFGNAGGVRVELNGEDLGSPGAPGDVVEVEYTPDGPSDT